MHISRLYIIAALLMPAVSAFAQSSVSEMPKITVNENITTVITASEPVKFVDISTDKVAGDQPIENTVRLKPKEGVAVNRDGDMLAVVTIVTERYRSQYKLIYASKIEKAVTDKTIELNERTPYNNPTVSMPTAEMAKYAYQIWTSPARYRHVKGKNQKMTMQLNNIYAVGEYFFIDFSVDNQTNIGFDIDQLRVKLNDKKTAKSTTVQTIELEPVFVLDRSTSFKKGYRNVIVLKKLTFPNDKVLTIELNEKQISGRTISMSINYKDVLSADSFNQILLKRK